MRRTIFLFGLLLATPAFAQDGDALSDFPPGMYAANPIGRSGVAHQACLASSAALVTGARPVGRCQLKRISADAQQTVITWRCDAGTSGRTTVRRDSGGVYTVHLQGVADGLPFAEHAEWRRSGNC